MKALSIKQPWADAIVHGTKRIENRGRPVPAAYIGVRTLLHASKAGDRRAVLNGIRPHGDVRGAILGAFTITGYHLDGDDCIPNCSFWGQDQLFHWQLADVVRLDQPVPAKGFLGFWTPPDTVLDAVYRQITTDQPAA